MDSDQGKLFIGGISWETSEDTLKDHFGKYGEVVQTVVMKDKATGRPRGFGFVAFADPSLLDHVLQDTHVIDGRTVEAKRALSREEQQHTSARSVVPAGGRAAGGGTGGDIRTKKIFVGGLPPTLSEEGFRQYFETYGTVTDVVVMYDQSTQRPRGFGFISFDSEDAVDRVLHKTFHDLNGKLVEVKRALPKDANSGSRSYGGGSYQSFGSSNASVGSYDGRTDANRYTQPQAAGGGYPGYVSSGFAAPAYGYGSAGSGAGYGGYGVGGYGGTVAGYGGPAGSYGNPPVGGYVSGPGAPRSSWSNQAPTGYASAGYGIAASWNAPVTGAGNLAAPTGQSPSGAAYGNQGYGYAGYSGNDGQYASQSTDGGRVVTGGPAGVAVNGGDQGTGYSGGGYGDATGASGYANAWRSDPNQGSGYGDTQMNGPPGGPASYGGYGSTQPRQLQQQ